MESRKAEIEADLAQMDARDRARRPLEHALSEIEGLLSGNLDQIPHMVAAELSKWLEASKHVGQRRPVG